jgi:hypothetical protein
MRLINCEKFELEEFLEDAAPRYAILSHTWEKEEVSFQQMQSLSIAKSLAGFSKIQNCCRQAIQDGLDYAWVDTCCIDKTSSAELQEAINSMFRWYQNATVCYAYLADVPEGLSDMVKEEAFEKSRWFTRGWYVV